jgi:hypothetical protein
MVVILLSRRQEVRARLILKQHRPWKVTRQGFFIVSDEAAQALKEAGVKFQLISRVAGT